MYEQATPALIAVFPLLILADAAVAGAWLAGLFAVVMIPLTVGALRVNRRYGTLWKPGRVRAGALAGIFLLTGPSVVLVVGATFSEAVWAALLNFGLAIAILGWKGLMLGKVLVWVACRIGHELRHLGYLAGRGLPMLVIFTLLTLFSNDVWHVAFGMGGGRLLGALVTCIVLGLLFLRVRLPEELSRRLKTEDSKYKEFGADEICKGWNAARNTQAGLRPLEDLFSLPLNQIEWKTNPQIGTNQERNMFFYLLLCQVIQVGILTSIVWLFFLGFGWLAVTNPVVTGWFQGAKLTYPYSVHFLGFQLPVVSNQLLDVSALMAIFAGVYFTVSAIADSDYREEFFDRTIDDLSHALCVRCAYLTLPDNSAATSRIPAAPLAESYALTNGATPQLGGKQKA